MPDPGAAPISPASPGARVAADGSPPPSSGLPDDFDGSDAAASSGRPEKPELYRAELPSDFALPAGVEYRFDSKDPLVAEARTLAHELGVDQKAFSRLLALHAKSELAEAQRSLAEVVAAENSLPNFPARKASINSALDGMLSREHAAAIRQGIGSKAAFEALETLIAKVTGRSPASSVPPVSERSAASRIWPQGFRR
jgi:hypothetical protein